MKRARGLTRVVALVAVSAALVTGPGVSFASAAPPTMARSEIIARAETALGLSYVWGKESWTPNLGTGSGTDCSGLVLKCWEVPRTLLYQEENGSNATISPRYTSYEFFNCLGPWFALDSRAELRPGDVLVKNNGTSGHVVIYAGGDDWSYPIIYEAPGTGLTIRRVSRYLGTEYLPRRREGLLETTSLVLDNPTAKSVGGSDVGANWTRSSSISGYYGADYQVRLGTTGEAWARWTPRFPASGYYDVYIRWTSYSNRTSSAKVVVKAAVGSFTSYLDQTTGGAQWRSLGRHYFTEGYSTTAGSVVLQANGATGYVVADAVKFTPVANY
jgi:hypothetical protein